MGDGRNMDKSNIRQIRIGYFKNPRYTKGRTNNTNRKEGMVVKKYRRKEKAFKQTDHLDELSMCGGTILKRILKK